MQAQKWVAEKIDSILGEKKEKVQPKRDQVMDIIVNNCNEYLFW